MKKIAMASVMFSLCAVNAFGADNERQRPGGKHQGPPPEAYTACEGKSAGDTAEFVSPRGDTVTGVCEEQSNGMVLRPDTPPSQRQRKGQGVMGQCQAKEDPVWPKRCGHTDKEHYPYKIRASFQTNR